jgi:hypothetical protein
VFVLKIHVFAYLQINLYFKNLKYILNSSTKPFVMSQSLQQSEQTSKQNSLGKTKQKKSQLDHAEMRRGYANMVERNSQPAHKKGTNVEGEGAGTQLKDDEKDKKPPQSIHYNKDLNILTLRNTGNPGSGWVAVSFEEAKKLISDGVKFDWGEIYRQEYKEPADLDVIHLIYSRSGGEEAFKNQENINSLGTEENSEFSPARNNKNDKYKRYVNTENQFLANEGGITPENFVNILLGHFIHGTGPENYVFPLNGAISKEMEQSEIFKLAKHDWVMKNKEAIASGAKYGLKPWQGGGSFNLFAQLSEFISEGSLIPLTVENFVGSAHIKITPLDNRIVEVTIFNVTSLTSGDLKKHLPWRQFPESRVEDLNKPKPQPYRNISQTFQFTFNITTSMREQAKQTIMYGEDPY